MTRFRSPARERIPEERFRRIFEAHYPAVFGFAARRVGPDAAPDVAAESFAVAWRKLSVIPEEPDTVPWLLGVARRVVANEHRSRRRRERLAAKVAATAQPGSRSEPDPGILDAFGRLPRRDREILRLAAWEGLDPRGLAVVLGCSPNAAAVRLHRARRRLDDAVSDLGGDR
jgi:RNA polymerase sigma-70 factor (ECF subfamily)